MSIYFILSIGIGFGCIAGFCIKYRYFSDEYIIGTDSDCEPNNQQSYIQYLEDMLNNSTNVTTESFCLHSIDSSYNNIISNDITVPLNIIDIDDANTVSSYSSTSSTASTYDMSVPHLIPTAIEIPYSSM